MADTKKVMGGKESVGVVLGIDNSYRVSGVTGDLFPLSDLVPRVWDNSLPTLDPKLRSERWKTLRPVINNLANFHSRLLERFPRLVNILPLSPNLFIAGGAVASAVQETLIPSEFSDLDIFVVGLEPEEATRLVIQTVQALVKDPDNQKEESVQDNKRRRFSYDDEDVSVFRTKHAISIRVHRIIYQIIFRIYKTRSEVLHGFDFGACAVGYDGKEVWFTSLGKWSHEYLCNIVDTGRRSLSYERRLSKYMERGFSLVLPNLNPTSVTVKQGRGLIASQSSIRLGTVELEFDLPEPKEGLRVRCARMSLLKRAPESEYEDMDTNRQFWLVLRAAAQNDPSGLVYASSDISEIEQSPLGKLITPDKDFIRKYYDGLYQRVISGKVKLTILRNYIRPEIRQKLEKLLLLDDTVKLTKELLDRQCLLTVQSLEEWSDLPTDTINWRVDNPGSQHPSDVLTSSFFPVISNPVDWYTQQHYVNSF